MCGRYLFFDEQNEKLKELIEAARKKLPAKTFEELSFADVYPSCRALAGIYVPEKKTVLTRVMRWGYTGSGRTVINARSETALTSRYFAGSQPCALPATMYYEWDERKKRYGFAAEELPFYLGGLCRKTADGYEFVILTEEAGMPQREIHPRQPVMFTYEDAKTWCAEGTTSSLEKSIARRLIIEA